MERLLALLPSRPQPPLIRFGVATILVAISLALFIGLHQAGGPYGLYLLYPAVFISAIAFDRVAGLYATAIELIGLYFLLRVPGSASLPDGYLLSLLLFAIIALAGASCSAGLRSAWRRAVQAQHEKDVLLQELGHRTKNNLMMVSSVLSLQARLKTNPETRAALEKAVLRVHAIAAAHDHVQTGGAEGGTNMRDYLEELCSQLGESLRDVRPIAIDAEVPNIELPTKQAVAIGLIVNELVINALKHAFPEGRAGRIIVRLEPSPLCLMVEDDGIGCKAKPGGIGSRLVQLLVRQVAGRIEWQRPERGCRVVIEMPSPGPPVEPGAARALNPLRKQKPAGGAAVQRHQHAPA